jgi:hypothetical protein
MWNGKCCSIVQLFIANKEALINQEVVLFTIEICYHSRSPVGSLTHLAATLKNLSIMDYRHVRDGLEQLTNLEVLSLHYGMPADFFLTHSNLPLKHMFVNPVRCPDFFKNTIAWGSAPTTLTSLALSFYGEWHGDTLPDALAKRITHLQLLTIHDGCIEQVTKILPGLQHLDLLLHAGYRDSILSGLSKLASLKRLGICMQYASWSCDQMLSKLPTVVNAVAKGVRLDVVEYVDFKGALEFPCPDTSVWTTLA